MSDIAQKSHKLASAIYLITGFFNDSEPLKWKLRSLVSEFVPVAVSLSSGFIKEKEATIYETKSLVKKIDGLLVVAKGAGLVSDGNFELMHGELMKYADSLDTPTDIPALLKSENPLLSERTREFAATPVSRTPFERITSEMKESHEVEQKDKTLRDFGAVSVKKNGRQSVIIGLLKRKKEIMIKDVVPLIKGCSEKTVQRELMAMVHAGVLKKMGEKRWSRYTLA